MNLITEELGLANEFMVEEVTFGSHTLAKLTKQNVAIVEAMIMNDSDYIKSSKKDAGPDNKSNYKGSAAFWFTKLKEMISDKTAEGYSYYKTIKRTIEAVDRENSTHLNADRCGREEIARRIYNFGKDKLIECLKNPEHGDLELFHAIEKKTSAEVRARYNPSFASKFCHYACFYLFEGTEYQDNYSIYDSILRKNLPMYLEYYGIDKKKYDLSKYEEYRKAIDEIRYSADELISRNGFDHLIWYYHKGRM